MTSFAKKQHNSSNTIGQKMWLHMLYFFTQIQIGDPVAKFFYAHKSAVSRKIYKKHEHNSYMAWLVREMSGKIYEKKKRNC